MDYHALSFKIDHPLKTLTNPTPHFSQKKKVSDASQQHIVYIFFKVETCSGHRTECIYDNQMEQMPKDKREMRHLSST